MRRLEKKSTCSEAAEGGRVVVGLEDGGVVDASSSFTFSLSRSESPSHSESELQSQSQTLPISCSFTDLFSPSHRIEEYEAGNRRNEVREPRRQLFSPERTPKKPIDAFSPVFMQ